ncbi:MAG: TlyA family RNA methyltransferase [Thermoanaerobaculia bacterium]|nr:TlyA family RNA methyltransferase [Thermoanaerobaculia bacterium]
MRLDLLLVERGLFESREKARRSIMAGQVRVNGHRVDKPGTKVAVDAELEVAERMPFVSRGGFKLQKAIEHFDLDVRGRICLDAGASTGGFTDCLLQRGAARVYAIDVGYGQLDYRLRSDARVVVMERVNIRYLPPDALPERVSVITVDVSFISLTQVVPALVPHLEGGGWLIPLIKPQFEVGKGQVGKGGIVRDEVLRQEVIEERVEDLVRLGFVSQGVVDVIPGAEGNREAMALLVKS